MYNMAEEGFGSDTIPNALLDWPNVPKALVVCAPNAELCMTASIACDRIISL
jgi:hypothetical protein